MNLKYHNDININFNVTTKLFNNNFNNKLTTRKGKITETEMQNIL